MTEQHPITPPEELLQEWCQQGRNCMSELNALKELATQSYRAGADQELDACCEWLDAGNWKHISRMLRAARRPKPKSLKEQALEALNEIEDEMRGPTIEEKLIRRALNALPD